MINLFWSIPQHFFHNTIAWPELNLLFNGNLAFAGEIMIAGKSSIDTDVATQSK